MGLCVLPKVALSFIHSTILIARLSCARYVSSRCSDSMSKTDVVTAFMDLYIHGKGVYRYLYLVR